MIDTERFRAPLAALEVVEMAKVSKREKLMLDVGGGHGVHTNFFRSNGFEVDLIDIIEGKPDRIFVGDALEFQPPRKYNYVWCSHVLEHIQDMGSFIRKLIECCEEGGVISATVPPLKSDMTFGHVTLWNAGLLLINFIKAGLDCREAKIRTYGYNVSIVTPNKKRDSSVYSNFLPPAIKMKGIYFDGDIENIGFSVKAMPKEPTFREFERFDPEGIAARLSSSKTSGFILSQKANMPGPRFFWWDAAQQRLVLVA